jgi:hypothetical protein
MYGLVEGNGGGFIRHRGLSGETGEKDKTYEHSTENLFGNVIGHHVSPFGMEEE